MFKRLYAVILIIAFCFFSVTAEEKDTLSEKDVSKGITVILDCISTSLISEYTLKNVSLPSSSLYIDSETNLPHRISFFLVDPSDFLDTIRNYIKTQSVPNSQLNVDGLNPYLLSVRDNLISKHYLPSGYFLTGSVIISYPEDVNLQELVDLFYGVSELTLENKVTLRLRLDLVLSGSEMDYPMSISGVFDLTADGSEVIFTSVDNYEINNITYPEIIYRF